ncbi:purine-cytosine permease family protein [Trinickia dinghuensis]|uniref:Purine-cytosine permease-like transporter n=1 Tax=Trinickia dinghuensis TaxID=2291023 RepID=A0A3D8K687_9BURK|nr:purine-cytosine permease-like transporter [Trinickia dinghuensis]RDV00397.1 purine-cytosine permease-like transporter [Trinickia dinghuensis]
MKEETLSATMEDHALERVPADARQGWLALSWNTAGVATTLVQLFLGALVTFVAGLKIALLAGVTVTVVGALLGWACGHVAYRSGFSSTVMSRHFGFGQKGSIISSLIFAFMIIGFLALENALLYRGFIFYFGIADTVTTRIVIYGLLSIAWILLTAYGFSLVARVSSITLVLFLAVLAYITHVVISGAAVSSSDLFSFGSQFPASVLGSMGATSDVQKFIFAVNVLIGSAGALALVDADLGRFARRSADIGIAALIGNLMMDVLMLGLGGIIMYAGIPALVDFYMHTAGMTHEAALHASLQSPDSIAAAFVVFGGALGALLMVLAQSKAQVINTYSASLSLSNLFDAFDFRPGRLTFVIVANIIGLIMLYGKILALVNSWITILGVLTTAFAGVIVADFFIVRRLSREPDMNLDRPAEIVNWAGVVTSIAAVVLSHYVLARVVPVEAISTIGICLVVYPVLRLTIFKPAYRGGPAAAGV